MDVVIEVDGRPLSQFGCDGVVMATATGSTAYAFSAGGPVLWPEVEALLVVPLNAHALFSRPVVVTPKSTLAVEVLGIEPVGSCGVTAGAEPSSRRERGCRPAVASAVSSWPGCTSARSRPSGGQVRPSCARMARRRPPARLASDRARRAANQRTRRHRRRRARALARPDGGHWRDLAPARRWWSAVSGCCSAAVATRVWCASDRPRAAIDGRLRVASGRVVEMVDELGGDLDDNTLLLSRIVGADGRSRAQVGGRSVPVGTLAELADELIAVHGQTDQLRLRAPARQRDAIDRFGGDDVAHALASYRHVYREYLDVETTLTETHDPRAGSRTRS